MPPRDDPSGVRGRCDDVGDTFLTPSSRWWKRSTWLGGYSVDDGDHSSDSCVMEGRGDSPRMVLMVSRLEYMLEE